jgi:DNA-binding CsgD family transcriptional regulator
LIEDAGASRDLRLCRNAIAAFPDDAGFEPRQRCLSMIELRSGAAVFRTGTDSLIREWNPACERLTGISAAEAEGRPCWEVMAGRDADGGIVCHPGCSIARLAKQGWPVRCTEVQMRTRFGPKQIAVSIIVLQDESQRTILHVLGETTGRPAVAPTAGLAPRFTRRQREILSLLVAGVRAKQIASRLSLSETTVRNHIQAILRELDAHSQLEAVARVHELSLALEEPTA